jgi:hypothetical protein
MRYIKEFEIVSEPRKSVLISLYPFNYGDEVEWYYPSNIPKKLQKRYDDMKFHVGDHVWFKNRKRIIRTVELFCKDDVPYYLEELEENITLQSEWVKPKDLVLIPEYEIDAEKYNL